MVVVQGTTTTVAVAAAIPLNGSSRRSSGKNNPAAVIWSMMGNDDNMRAAVAQVHIRLTFLPLQVVIFVRCCCLLVAGQKVTTRQRRQLPFAGSCAGIIGAILTREKKKRAILTRQFMLVVSE